MSYFISFNKPYHVAYVDNEIAIDATARGVESQVLNCCNGRVFDKLPSAEQMGLEGSEVHSDLDHSGQAGKSPSDGRGTMLRDYSLESERPEGAAAAFRPEPRHLHGQDQRQSARAVTQAGQHRGQTSRGVYCHGGDA